MPKDTEGSELEALFPTPVVVPMDGDKKIEVRTLSIAEWAPLAAELKPFFETVQVEGFWLSGVLKNMDCLVGAIALSTGLTREAIGALHPKPFRKVARKFMEYNGDFFGLCLDLADCVNTATAAVRSDGDGPPHAAT